MVEGQRLPLVVVVGLYEGMLEGVAGWKPHLGAGMDKQVLLLDSSP
jgi:hypothetical protein